MCSDTVVIEASISVVEHAAVDAPSNSSSTLRGERFERLERGFDRLAGRRERGSPGSDACCAVRWLVASSASVAETTARIPALHLARELAQVQRHALERGREHGDLAVALAARRSAA